MYAVIKTGGKQYRVQAGDVLRVEKLDAEAGATVDFGEVLMVGDGDEVQVGAPLLDGGKVTAKVVDHDRGEKIRIVKFRRRKHHRKQQGHRQALTRIEITGIEVPGAKKQAKGGKQPAAKGEAKKPAKAEQAEKTEKARAEKTQAEETPAKPAAGGDDLKRMTGLGPAIEKKFHAAGITTYEQIADLDEEEAQALDERLELKGRIQRENWVAQARELAAGDAPQTKED